MKSFFLSLDDSISTAKYNANEKQYNLCMDIKTYLLNSNYSNYKNLKLFMSYWGEPDSYMAKMTGMKESTIRVTRRNLSNLLYDKFGYDFFSLLNSGDNLLLAEAKSRFELVKKDVDSDSYVLRLVKEECVGVIGDALYSIRDCSNEIKFLVKHSIPMIKNEISSLDKGKLLYLLSILDGNDGSIQDRVRFIKVLEGK